MGDYSTVIIEVAPEHGEALQELTRDHGCQEEASSVMWDEARWGDADAEVVATLEALTEAKIPFVCHDAGHYTWSPTLQRFDGVKLWECESDVEGNPLASKATYDQIRFSGPAVEFFFSCPWLWIRGEGVA